MPTLCAMPTERFQRPPVAVFTLVRAPSELPLGTAARARVRVLEVRLDRFAPSDWKGIVREAGASFPQARLLATLRFQKDGGNWPDDASRAEALAEVFSLREWDYLDLEWDAFDFDEITLRLSKHSAWTRLVCSRHDFVPPSEGISQALAALWNAATIRHAAVAKWAGTLADPEQEIMELCTFAALHGDEGIVPSLFAMGSAAQVTRVASALLSGGWSYGHDGVGEAAPGQLPWSTLDALLQSLPQPQAFTRSWLDAVAGAIRMTQD